MTNPLSFSTIISPVTQLPEISQLGSRVIIVPPISSTTIIKSVPLTLIFALGVRIFTLCLLFFAIWPLAYLTVPSVAFRPRLPLPVFGSYTKSSIRSLACSVISTLVSSIKSILILPFAVTAVSID